MNWGRTHDTDWFSECGLGRISRYDSDGRPQYYAMWYRLQPGHGMWLQVKTANGRVTFRRSLEKACEAIESAIRITDIGEAA